MLGCCTAQRAVQWSLLITHLFNSQLIPHVCIKPHQILCPLSFATLVHSCLHVYSKINCAYRFCGVEKQGMWEGSAWSVVLRPFQDKNSARRRG